MNNRKIASKLVTGTICVIIGIGLAKSGSRYILDGLTELADRYIPSKGA